MKIREIRTRSIYILRLEVDERKGIKEKECNNINKKKSEGEMGREMFLFTFEEGL